MLPDEPAWQPESQTRLDGPQQSAPLSEPLPRGTSIGRYVVLDLLGRGGMGVVYAAYDPELDRKVAVKLLRTDKMHPDDRSQGRLRMLREARALARLSHPNVVALYDAGLYHDDVYLAMEMIEGHTAAAWLDLGPRSWRDIVGAYAQAGRGLAAAHAAGLVHRDFKPSNVVVCNDGRVRVLDFGLARAVIELTDSGRPLDLVTSQEHSVPLASDSVSKEPLSLDQPLTEVGQAVGTLAYMAPEVLSGDGADARSDQYAFCVALYQALYGQHPFPGRKRREFVRAVITGNLAPEPKDRKVPPWLRRAVLRGLSTQAANRWPSMEALLWELERDPARQRLRWLTSIAVFTLGVGTTWAFVQSREPGAACDGGAARVSEIWNDATAGGMAQAFAATGIAYAPETWERTSHIIDDYLRAWSSKHEQVCEATYVRREQSEVMLDLRMQCMDARLSAARALIGVLGQPDASVVQNAVGAAASLPTLTPCDGIDPNKLNPAAAVDERERNIRAELQNQLAEVEALDAAGKYKDSLEIARRIYARANEAGYPSALAEARFALGVAEARNGQFEQAAKDLAEAGWLAEASGNDEVLARAQTRLVHVVGYELARLDEGLAWSRHAAAAIARLEDHSLLHADLLHEIGTLHNRQERFTDAMDNYEQALALRTAIVGSEHPSVARTLSSLGLVSSALDRHGEAMDYLQRTLALRVRAQGPNHPDVAIALNNLAFVEGASGRDDLAYEHLQRAAAVFEASVGRNHPHLAATLNSLGSASSRMGDREQALAHWRRALEIRETALGKDHPNVAAVLGNIAEVLTEEGRWTEAAEHLKRAQDIVVSKLGSEHSMLAMLLDSLGRLQAVRGETEQAKATALRAVQIMEKARGPMHSELTPLLVSLGKAHVETGEFVVAVEVLERALKGPFGRGGTLVKADAQFALARALWELGGADPRSLELAAAAKATYATAGKRFEQPRSRIEAWQRPRVGGRLPARGPAPQ